MRPAPHGPSETVMLLRSLRDARPANGRLEGPNTTAICLWALSMRRSLRRCAVASSTTLIACIARCRYHVAGRRPSRRPQLGRCEPDLIAARCFYVRRRRPATSGRAGNGFRSTANEACEARFGVVVAARGVVVVSRIPAACQGSALADDSPNPLRSESTNHASLLAPSFKQEVIAVLF